MTTTSPAQPSPAQPSPAQPSPDLPALDRPPSSQRIVLIVSVFPKLSETFIVRQFLGLLDAGWDVHVVCQHCSARDAAAFPKLSQVADWRRRVHLQPSISPRPSDWWRLAVTALRLLFSPARSARYLSRAMPAGGLRSALRGLLRDAPLVGLRPALVHFEFGSLAAERPGLGHRLQCRTVVSFRGFDLNFVGLDQPHYYRSTWQDADACHFLGEDLRQRALRRGCPADKPFALIPPAVDIAEYEVRDPPEDAPAASSPLRITSIGRLEWKKGYEYCLEAVRQLVDSGIDCRYRIVGSGSFRQAVSLARHQLGLEQQVELLGALPHEQVIEELRQTDILLHLAVSEGFCNAVIEAQAMAVPVVCSDADGLSENVANGETGFVVPRRDPRAASQRLEQLARDAQLRRQFGAAGRRRVASHFAIEGQIQAFSELYQRFLAGPGIEGREA